MGNVTFSLDGFFLYSLIRDVCEVLFLIFLFIFKGNFKGLCFLHNSAIGWHGNLRSTNCLIDERWQVKLSDFGLKFLRVLERRESHGYYLLFFHFLVIIKSIKKFVFLELVWTAPELLRENNIVGTKQGNIFFTLFTKKFIFLCLIIIKHVFRRHL